MAFRTCTKPFSVFNERIPFFPLSDNLFALLKASIFEENEISSVCLVSLGKDDLR